MEEAVEIFKRKTLSPSPFLHPPDGASGRAMITTGAVAVTAAFSGDGHDGHFLSWGGIPTDQKLSTGKGSQLTHLCR